MGPREGMPHQQQTGTDAILQAEHNLHGNSNRQHES